METRKTFRNYLSNDIEIKINFFMNIDAARVNQLENEHDRINKLTEKELIARYPYKYKEFKLENERDRINKLTAEELIAMYPAKYKKYQKKQAVHKK